MTDPRKATDVLLSIESKLETVLKGLQSQDFNNKIIANRLSSLFDKVEQAMRLLSSIDNQNINMANNVPKITMEAVNSNGMSIADNIKNVVTESNMSVENAPLGFRRTSRPESFQNVPAPQPKLEAQQEEFEFRPVEIEKLQQKLVSGNYSESSNLPAISVIQRVVDRNNKSIFLAEVEINNLENNALFGMFKTSGTGKWSANIPLGRYRITIRKRESLTKEKIEVTQDITVDGTKSPMELSTLIIK